MAWEPEEIKPWTPGKNDKPLQKFLPKRAMPAYRPKPSQFPQAHVSAHVHTLIVDLQEAAGECAQLDGLDPQYFEAYSTLSIRRKALYEYLDGLEEAAGISRNITMRF